MAEAGIVIVSPDQLTQDEQAWLETYFMTHLFPLLTPIAVDPAHPFPFIPNRGFTLGLELAKKKGGAAMHALMPVPAPVDRFLRLPAGEDAGAIRFMRIETLIGHFASFLFPGYEVKRQGAFRILRDSDMCFYAEEDAIAPLWKGSRFPMGACVSGWAMLNRQPAVIEELFFRYLALGALRSHVGLHLAVFLSSLMFAAAHLGQFPFIPALLVIGIGLGYVRHFSGGLLLPMLIHFGHNLVVLLAQ